MHLALSGSVGYGFDSREWNKSRLGLPQLVHQDQEFSSHGDHGALFGVATAAQTEGQAPLPESRIPPKPTKHEVGTLHRQASHKLIPSLSYS